MNELQGENRAVGEQIRENNSTSYSADRSETLAALPQGPTEEPTINKENLISLTEQRLQTRTTSVRAPSFA